MLFRIDEEVDEEEEDEEEQADDDDVDDEDEADLGGIWLVVVIDAVAGPFSRPSGPLLPLC
jgi:hypothetical protein